MTLLSDVHYCAPNVAYIPNLKELVHHAFSWGRGSPNMSRSHGAAVDVIKAEAAFFERASLSQHGSRAVMIPEHKSSIAHIDLKSVANVATLHVTCDCLITALPNITLVVKPADCPVSIIVPNKNHARRFVAVLHSGRAGLDARLPYNAVQHIASEFHISPQELVIGVAPCITVKHHFIRSLLELKHPELWTGCIQQREGLFFLDFSLMLEKQYLLAGVLPENIMMHDVDTFAAASRGESFSHRFWQMNSGHANGRFLVAAEL